jgi:hypothetical protein
MDTVNQVRGKCVVSACQVRDIWSFDAVATHLVRTSVGLP